MTFKMVEDRAALARRFEAFLEANAETASRTLARFFAGISEHPEELWLEDELLRHQLLGRWVARLRRQMVEAAGSHAQATRQLEDCLAQQRAAFEDLYDRLVDARREARDLYGGADAVWIFGIRGRTRREAGPLADQAREVVSLFSRPERGVEKFPGLAVRRQAWAQALAPRLAELERALRAVTAAKAEKVRTLKHKHGTMKEFDRLYGAINRYVRRAYELVHHLDELAAVLPPAAVRPARTRTEPSTDIARTERPASERPDVARRVLAVGRRLRRRLAGWLPAFGRSRA